MEFCCVLVWSKTHANCLKDFYLKLGLLECEHMRIKISTMPKKSAEEYDLYNLVDAHGNFYAVVRSGIHVLPQLCYLAYEDLVSRLVKCGCEPVKFRPGFWKHMNNGISFTLVADYFGIKFYAMKSLKKSSLLCSKNMKLQRKWKEICAQELL